MEENIKTQDHSALNIHKKGNLNTYLIAGAVIFLIIIIVLALVAFLPRNNSNNNNQNSTTPTPTASETPTPSPTEEPTPTPTPTAEAVKWSNNGTDWSATGTPPACPSPLTFNSPGDITKATAILYPGQVRGTDYKPHGGMRFDNSKNSDISVTLPMDAIVYRGSRYIEGGETQYMFDFIAPCGIFFRFDHLLTLSEKYQTIANTLPEPTASTFTTVFNPAPEGTKGEVIASAVGFVKTKNVGFDIGVYDLRQRNQAAQSTTYVNSHKDDSELAYNALCWLDNLTPPANTIARALPAGDQKMGKRSDYCK